jgi:hypothetical protein
VPRTIDQVFDEIEKVRAQKAELQKKEKELTREAQQLLDKQSERAKLLGFTPVPPETRPERVEDRVSIPAEDPPATPKPR